MMLLIFITSASATVPISHDEQRISNSQLTATEKAYTQWLAELNNSLLKASNAYKKTMGIAAAIKGIQASQQLPGDKPPEPLLHLIAELNTIIKQEKLSNLTLSLLADVCFSPLIEDKCFKDILLNKQLTQDSTNLIVYLKPLQLALKENNDELVSNLITVMSKSQLSYEPIGIAPDLDEAINDFVTSHPIPSSFIEAFKDDKALLSDLTEDISKNLDQNIATYLSTSVKLSYSYLHNKPDFSPLMHVCKTNEELVGECVVISQIMINHSNSIMVKGIGFSLLMAIHEVNEQEQYLKTTAKNHDTYKATIECLYQSAHPKNHINNFLDPEYQKINLKMMDEFEKLKQLAQYNYNKYHKTDSTFVNPETCM